MPETRMAEPGAELATWCQFFNEIGILHQLSRTVLERHLPAGMSAAHFSVLNYLVRVKDGQTPRALAAALQVAKTTMSHTLSGLQARELIMIKRNPLDGRSKQVWLTPAGGRLRLAAIGSLGEDVARLAGQFDTRRVRAVNRLPAVRQAAGASG